MALAAKGATAYVAYGDTICNADLRYLTGFKTTDPIVYIRGYGEPPFIIVSAMEAERARQEAKVEVRTRNEVGFYEILEKEGEDRIKALARTIATLCRDHLLLPPDFPLAIGMELSKHCKISIDEKGVVRSSRARKSAEEIANLAKTQRVAEEAMRIAVRMISKAKIEGGVLVRDGKTLTSEQVKKAIHRHFVVRGCTARGTIVSCGKDTAIPHHEGRGPLLADEPIVIDIFPQNERGYYADMTRTFVRGEPAVEIVEMFNTVKRAKAHAIEKIRAGANGAEIHQSVLQLFRESGYESETQGFIHNLGHGVGLEVHELPILGKGGGLLEAGNVVTVEPGLYYRDAGGVRLEDMGVIHREGFRVLTRFEEECVV